MFVRLVHDQAELLLEIKPAICLCFLEKVIWRMGSSWYDVACETRRVMHISNNEVKGDSNVVLKGNRSPVWLKSLTGRPISSMALPKTLAPATIKRMAVVVMALSRIASQNPCQVSVRRIRVVMINAAADPTAAASVGVNAPE